MMKTATALFSLWLALILPFSLWLYSKKWSEFENKQHLISAINKELKLLTPWLLPAYHDATLENYKLTNQHFIWYSPTYRLTQSNFFTLGNLVSNPSFLELQEELVTVILVMNQLMKGLYDEQTELRRYVYSSYALYDKANIWFNDIVTQNPKILTSPGSEFYSKAFPPNMDPVLQRYLIEIYNSNYLMFVCEIGGDEPRKEAPCTYKEFGLHFFWLRATDLVKQEMLTSKPPSFVFYFWPLGLMIPAILVSVGYRYMTQ